MLLCHAPIKKYVTAENGLAFKKESSIVCYFKLRRFTTVMLSEENCPQPTLTGLLDADISLKIYCTLWTRPTDHRPTYEVFTSIRSIKFLHFVKRRTPQPFGKSYLRA